MIIRAGRLATVVDVADGALYHLLMDQIFLDPGTITAASWIELGSLLRSVWFAVLFIVFFASNMIVAHNLIPSFIESGHIGESWGKARPVLYGGASVGLAAAAFFIYRAADFAGVLRNFWPDYWI